MAAINALVDTYRSGLPGLQNIVLVGADDVVPFARVPDLTKISNESDYTNDALAINGNNGLVGSFVTSNILSDTAYGDFHPKPWLNRQIFVPEVALGRLVETPDQIQFQIAQFQTFNGQLDPATALTTGYDFLADGANKVGDEVDGVVGASNNARLVNGTWTSADLTAAFESHTPVPGLDSINAHFDHYRLLPGAGNTANDESDLYTTAKIKRTQPTDPRIVPGAVIFSMGCHSGLNVPDLIAPAPNADQQARLLDWPQAFADQGAGVYVANTGYGYGDTDIVAYSEDLMARFAAKFGAEHDAGAGADGGEAGVLRRPGAVRDVRREGAGGDDVLRPADGAAAAAGVALVADHVVAHLADDSSVTTASVTPTPLPFSTDPVTGLDIVPFNLNPNFHDNDLGSLGHYDDIDGQKDASAGRPIMPVTGFDLPAGAGREDGARHRHHRPAVDGRVAVRRGVQRARERRVAARSSPRRGRSRHRSTT